MTTSSVDMAQALREHREAGGPFLDSIRAFVELEPDDAREWVALMRRRYPSDKKTNVYFIQCKGTDGPIKIGVARDVGKRLSHLRIGNPYPLALLVSVPAPLTVESLLHGRFSSRRIRGEWFRAAPDLVRFVEQLKAGT